MNTRKSLAWAWAGMATLCVALPALAQDYPPPRQDRDRGYSRQDGPPGPERDRGDRGDRHDQRQWQRGERYDGPRYIVDDYRRYDLPPPPDDHHRWVRDRNGDYILVAITTGIITDLLLNAGHR